MLRLGLVLNPVAGVGGAAALKGSDGIERQALARARGSEPRVHARVLRTLAAVRVCADVEWYTWGGAMGERALRDAGITPTVVGVPTQPSSAADTRRAAQALANHGVALLVFAGGDGTARDLLDTVGSTLPVLGIPAGVKMHSGVFATTPETAGEILLRLAEGGLVAVTTGAVRDRQSGATSDQPVQHFGELSVPELGGFLQRTKEAGREQEALVVTEIAAWVAELVEQTPGLCILGPGSTLAAVKRSLGMEPTLLGVDVLGDGRQVGQDVDARWLEAADLRNARLFVTFTGNQGFLFGRGNQQLSAAVLRQLPREAVTVVGTRTKLTSLEGRPLLVDTDDPELDRALSGLVEIVAGYDDVLLYRVATHG